MVQSHESMTLPPPKIPGFNANDWCGNTPQNLAAFGLDSNGQNILQYVIAGQYVSFDYQLAHNFGSLQSVWMIGSSNYADFGPNGATPGNSTKIKDGIPYNQNADNTFQIQLPMQQFAQASLCLYSDQLEYGNCADFTIRCPIALTGTMCNQWDQNELTILRNLQATNETAFQEAIAELNAPEFATIKSELLDQLDSSNGPSTGGAIAIAIFVIAFVGIVAGLLYYRHKKPEEFAVHVDNMKMHMGNAWDWVKTKASSSGGSSSSTLPTRSYVSNGTPATKVNSVQVQPSNTSTGVSAAAPAPPPKKTNLNTATGVASGTPPPKQGGQKAPSPPSSNAEFNSTNAANFKYSPPAKALPSQPQKPTPPPKRTNL